MPETTMISASHWLENAIDQEYLNFHDFDKFSDLVPVGDGPLGKVYRAQWQIRGMVVALKSWIDETSKEEKRILDEFMNELKMHRKVDYHPNILRFYGLSKDVCSKKYLLVLEYADGGTLRQYLKQNHSSLTWADRINLARQVTSGVACLHDNGILLGDLHANNILVKDGAIKISDISLSKQFSRISDAVSGAKGDIAYVEPQNLKSLQYEPNDKSDIYSIGVLLWEISSGRPPFQTSAPPTAMSQIQIATRISNGEREEPVKDSPCEYVKIYRQCWRDDPIKRPDIHEVLNILLNIEIPDNLSNAINISNGIGIVSTRPIKTRGNSDDKILKEGSDDKILSSSPTESASSDGTLCSITEVDQLPTNNDKKLSTELGKKKPQVNLGGKRLSTDVGGCRRLGCRGLSVEVGSKRLSANLGSKKSPTDVASRNSSIDVGRKLSTETGKMKSPTKETVRKKSSLDVSEKKPSNSDVGNKTSTERPKPARRVTSINTELSQSIRKTENRRSSFNGVSGNTTPTTPTNPNSIANKKIIDNTDAAFFEDLLKFFISILEISGDFPAMISSIKEYLHNKSREHKSTFKALIKHKDNPAFGSIIGFFYENSIGTVQDKQAAFTSYKKSADSGDAIGQYFLGRCYYWGHGIKTDRKKAFELLQKSSENGNSRGQWMLGFCYERGYGTTKDLKKAFEQFLHSAEAGNVTSQMELGRCYEEGIGVDKNLGKAIECYQHAFARGHVLASKKIEALKKAQRRNSSITKVGPKE